LVAALKKHLIVNSKNESTFELSSLVEKNKNNETVMREDESHYNTIKSYTESLPESSGEYPKMMEKIENTLQYFSDSTGYKKEKLDDLMNDFITNLTKC